MIEQCVGVIERVLALEGVFPASSFHLSLCVVGSPGVFSDWLLLCECRMFLQKKLSACVTVMCDGRNGQITHNAFPLS